MDKAERLVLAVRARVASVLAAEAKERMAFSEKQFEPFVKARERFAALHRREPGTEDEVWEVIRITVELGGGHLRAEHWASMLAQQEEYLRLVREDIAATEALMGAWDAVDGTTILEWTGCTGDELETAVQLALHA